MVSICSECDKMFLDCHCNFFVSLLACLLCSVWARPRRTREQRKGHLSHIFGCFGCSKLVKEWGKRSEKGGQCSLHDAGKRTARNRSFPFSRLLSVKEEGSPAQSTVTVPLIPGNGNSVLCRVLGQHEPAKYLSLYFWKGLLLTLHRLPRGTGREGGQ